MFRALCALLFVLALFALPATRPAWGDEDEELAMAEKFKIVVDELGNARVTCTLVYPDELYEELEDLVDEYPDFLVRRYLLGETLKEIENYEVKMRGEKNQVVISYDSPGFAYNWGDHWALQGFPAEPVGEEGTVFVFEKEYVGNDDLTLYKNVDIERTTQVEVPACAVNVRYDREEGAIEYEIPRVEEASFFGRNRAPLAVVFALLTLAFLAATWGWLRMTRVPRL